MEDDFRLISRVDELMNRYPKGHDLAPAAIEQAPPESLIHGRWYFKPDGVPYLNPQRPLL